MSSLPILSGKKIIKILSRLDFYISRQKGSHIILVKYLKDRKRVVVIPNHKEIDPGTLLSIISQAGMTKEEFLDLV